MGRQIQVFNKNNLPETDIKNFVETQGNLKTVTDIAYQKLMDSIMTNGFIYSIIVWKDDGTLYLIDGHLRKKLLLEMRKDGWYVPPIFYYEIKADSLTDAKKKLLLFNNRYGIIDNTELYEFMEKANIEVESFMENYMHLDDNHSKQFVQSHFREFPEVEKKQKASKLVKCKSCGEEFYV